MDKKKFATLSDLNKKDKEEDGKTVKHYTGSDKSGAYTQEPDKYAQLSQAAQQMKQGGQLKEKNDCKIVIYQNGFKVNDDEFVPLNEQEMQKFIECLKNSQFPKELLYLQKQYGSDLQPDIELRMEDYRPPTPPKHVAYSGNSVKLGEEKSQAGQVNLEGGEIKVDKSKPTTSIQIRLHNGQTKQIEINIDDRVQTLFDYVQQIAPVQGTFQLIAGFPPKPLKNMNETIEDADLEDTRIQQKLE